MLEKFLLLLLLHSSTALFESCDKTFELETDENVTISSFDTLNLFNASSCRYTVSAPVNYIIDVTCVIQIDQSESHKCPLKRFFLSLDGHKDLRNSDYFCNRYGARRKFRRRSVLNRLTMAYVTQVDVTNDRYICSVRRVLSPCDCGWSRKARIFNGNDANLHEFPSMIALVALPINRVFCGGVIISERWGLTGAHCFNEELYADLSNVAAYVGEHDLSSSSETIYTESYELEKYVRHENYSREAYEQDFDIALIRTVKAIVFNAAVAPACLPWEFQEDSFDGKFVTVTGFGLLDFFGTPAKILQKVSLQILPIKYCKDSIYNSAKMCTYAEKKDSCTSDSGGPLYYSKGRQYVIGLVSYGVGCGTKTPSVNSRITSYLPWIVTVTEDDSFCRKS
ncbi:CLUMA_CG003079, isoform A [Clunio marinus]|uniref:CLUMA_CG003079, isoform A n=1 Tax=Clunio marinus TaxID=568069 RepID=A0A1J1HMM9_9DIPT|nr:CLUMA_CG003079, isoform A [Clunio marinus]